MIEENSSPPIFEEQVVHSRTKAEDITFLVVGCQRCGSTWLYEALKEHPEVYVPEKKQLHFFDEPENKDLNWYLGHFDKIEPHHKAIGEVATSYCLPKSIPRLVETFPNVKIIMAMREPVSRALSYYNSRSPFEDWKSFDEAVAKDPRIVSRGEYIDQIEILLEFYDRESILFLFYDDLKRDEKAYINSVYEFLGVNTTFEPSVIGNPVRAAVFPGLRGILNKAGLSPLVNLVNRSRLGDGIRQLTLKSRRAKKAPRKTPGELHPALQSHFSPYNDRIRKLTGRELREWNK